MKKIITTIGALTLAIAPLTTVVSCFGSKGNELKADSSVPNDEKDAATAFNPLTISAIKTELDSKLSTSAKTILNQYIETYDLLFAKNADAITMISAAKTTENKGGMKMFKTGREVYQYYSGTEATKAVEVGSLLNITYNNAKIIDIENKTVTKKGEIFYGGKGFNSTTTFQGVFSSREGGNMDGEIFYGKDNVTHYIMTVASRTSEKPMHIIIEKSTGNMLVTTESTFGDGTGTQEYSGEGQTNADGKIFTSLYPELGKVNHLNVSFKDYNGGATKISALTKAKIEEIIESYDTLILPQSKFLEYMKDDVEKIVTE